VNLSRTKFRRRSVTIGASHVVGPLRQRKRRNCRSFALTAGGRGPRFPVSRDTSRPLPLRRLPSGWCVFYTHTRAPPALPLSAGHRSLRSASEPRRPLGWSRSCAPT
jgi:hypothetical protein